MPLDGTNSEITFFIDGKEVTALPGETIWQAAKRLGTDIPPVSYTHLTLPTKA